jgi:hypothetical protein
MTEQWRAIPGYEGYYEASSIGRVRSVARSVAAVRGGKTVIWNLKSKNIRPRSKLGYSQVTLSVAAVHRHFRVHRLVLESFVGPCPDGMEALHANDIRDDNRLENLRWGTRTENLHDMVRNGNHHGAKKTNCKRGHPFVGENVKPQSSSGQGRACRECCKQADRQRYINRRDEIRAQQNAHAAKKRADRAQVVR